MSITPSVAIDNVKKTSIPISTGKTLYVGGSGPGNYTTIQDAIDNASDWDTVFVFDDSSPYYENIIVDKSINLIGEDRNSTVIDGNDTGDVVKIINNWVTVRDFTIENSGYEDFGAGVSINSNYNTIKGNILNNNCIGVYISVYNSNFIIANNISNNIHGIISNYSNFNIIVSNTINSNTFFGIELEFCNHNTIKGNNISNNLDGICIGYSKFNIIKSNNINFNKEWGIFFGLSFFNIIIKNNFLNNDVDAFFWNSFRNRWIQNYWNKPLRLPKYIFGGMGVSTNYSPYIFFPWFQFDWFPASEPYDI
ncbi:MAG: right-handed parallel beta-helix repeat-containing protein [Thermoplasmatales archaeon]|nr:MAG: right-handed parallel beta-helix repeat-containing protein [Thermoplasmatales archaeon]